MADGGWLRREGGRSQPASRGGGGGLGEFSDMTPTGAGASVSPEPAVNLGPGPGQSLTAHQLTIVKMVSSLAKYSNNEENYENAAKGLIKHKAS